jgi:hypothetical protein
MKTFFKAFLGILTFGWFMKKRAENDVQNDIDLNAALTNYANSHKEVYKSIVDLEESYRKKHPGKQLFTQEFIDIYKNPPTLNLRSKDKTN